MRVLQPKRLANGFTWLPVHYTHDPDKASAAWLVEAQRAYPRPQDWDREMEIDFGLKVGSPCYPRFSIVKHTANQLEYDERRPLCLTFDFNVNPMSLIVGQMRKPLVLVLREFVYEATIDQIVADFRSTYPAHRGNLYVYGDASNPRNPQTSEANWDVVRAAFRGYPIQPDYKVTRSNPGVGQRLTAVNRLFQGDGEWQVVINKELCPQLVLDFQQVVYKPNGKDILKSGDPDDPYYFRTHASDAFGYWIYYEMPVVKERLFHEGAQEHRPPIDYKGLLGEVDRGPKWRQQQGKRKPINYRKAR